MSLNHAKVSTKLAIAFGVMVLLLVMLGIFIFSMATNIKHAMLDIAERRTPIIRDLGYLRDEINLQARLTRNLVILTEPAELDEER